MGGSKFLLLRRIKEAIVAGFAPDPSGGSPGDLIEVNAGSTAYQFRGAPIEAPDPSALDDGSGMYVDSGAWATANGLIDPVLLKVPDASILANSPSIWYPEEADTNQASLVSGGYTIFGDTTNPPTAQILSGVLQVDVPSAHAGPKMATIGIPMTVAASTDFDAVVVLEPEKNLLATNVRSGNQRFEFVGVADTASDTGRGMFSYINSVISGVSYYYATTDDTPSTGTIGSYSATANLNYSSVLRICRRGTNTLWFSVMDAMGSNRGWQPVYHPGLTAGDTTWEGWLDIGSTTWTTAITHLNVGMLKNYASAGRVRFRAVWRVI